MNELEIARAIAQGQMQSPQDLGGSWLFAVRITGTGLAKREKERVWRDPDITLTPEFLARCNGLQVIWEHPPGHKLTSDEFTARTIGAVTFPYLADRDGFQNDIGPDVWGIARVFDRKAAELLASEPASTSPCVILGKPEQNTEYGDLLIEGEPSRLDHVAICRAGVWDKGDAPSGVRVDHTISIGKDSAMADNNEQKKADEDGDVTSKILTILEGLDKRLCAMEDGARKADGLEETMAGEGEGGEDGAEREEVKPVAYGGKETADDDYERRNALAEIRTRADNVASAWGMEALRPFTMEKPRDYLIRNLTRWQSHSKQWKDVALHKLEDAALKPIAEAIFADAAAASFDPATAGRTGLREIRRPDQTGRMVSTFVGHPSAWMDDFKSPKQFVRKINRDGT